MTYRPKIKDDSQGTLVDLPLDAETLDGKSASDFVDLTSNQTIDGVKSFEDRPQLVSTPRLPNTYQEVTYIQASGSQYIDTGFKSTTEKLKVEFACAFPFGMSGQSLMGSNSPYSLVPYGTGGNVISHWVGSSGGIMPITYEASYNAVTYELDNGSISCTINGSTTSTTYNGTIINDYNFYIFGKNGGGSSSERGAGYRLYYLKITNNGTLVRNFIPCYRISDSVIGLYDLVNNTFYTNAGSGTFVKGGNVGTNDFVVDSDLADYVPTTTKINGKMLDGNITLSASDVSALPSSTSYVESASVSGNTLTLTPSSGSNVTFTNTTYESKTASSGGTDVSLVTTGEKYTWNNKGTYSKPSGGIPASDLAESYYLASNPSGYTTNTGTVTSVRVQAGTGLSSSTSTAQSSTLNTTISIASGYKLPTTSEWSGKQDSLTTSSVNDGTVNKAIGFDSNGNLIKGTISGGMTNPMTTAGDIIVGGTSGTPARLGKGSTDQILTMGANSPQWADKYIDGTTLTGNSTFQNVFDLLGSSSSNRTGIIKFDIITIGGTSYNLGIGIVYAWAYATPNCRLEIITPRYKLYGTSTSTSTTLSNLNITDLNTYISNPMTTAGDIIYGGSSGTPTRLAKGSAGQVLTMNSGGTLPEWKTLPTNLEIVSNKVTSISSSSTDTQYPSAKCVYDLVGDIETLLTALNTGTGV